MVNFYSSKLGKNVQQISKRRARRLYEQNVEIFLMASNLRFDNGFSHPMPLQKCRRLERDSFDGIVNEFEWYNCDSERGKYTHFYVAEKDA